LTGGEVIWLNGPWHAKLMTPERADSLPGILASRFASLGLYRGIR